MKRVVQPGFMIVAMYLVIFVANCTVSEIPSRLEARDTPRNFADTVGNLVYDTMGDPCTPNSKKLSRADCKKGFICAPNPMQSDIGNCLIECGANVDGRLVRKHEKCPGSLKCMMYRDAALSPIGMFCLKPQSTRDRVCLAPLDEEACLGSLTCMPMRPKENEIGRRLYQSFMCKEECTAEKSCQNDDEICLKPDYARTERKPGTDKETTVACDVKSCAAHDPACPCDTRAGYTCARLMEGITTGACVRTRGVCGTAIALASTKDLTLTDSSDNRVERCNEISASRICRKENTAPVSCHLFGNKSDEGSCIARCANPLIDQNSDGKISQRERNEAKTWPCPPNFSCSRDLGRALGVIRLIPNEHHPRACDATQCSANMPCPEQCGPKDAECLAIGAGDKKRYVCGAPFGICAGHGPKL